MEDRRIEGVPDKGCASTLVKTTPPPPVQTRETHLNGTKGANIIALAGQDRCGSVQSKSVLPARWDGEENELTQYNPAQLTARHERKQDGPEQLMASPKDERRPS